MFLKPVFLSDAGIEFYLFLCLNESWEHVVFKTGPTLPNRCF